MLDNIVIKIAMFFICLFAMIFISASASKAYTTDMNDLKEYFTGDLPGGYQNDKAYKNLIKEQHYIVWWTDKDRYFTYDVASADERFCVYYDEQRKSLAYTTNKEYVNWTIYYNSSIWDEKSYSSYNKKEFREVPNGGGVVQFSVPILKNEEVAQAYISTGKVTNDEDIIYLPKNIYYNKVDGTLDEISAVADRGKPDPNIPNMKGTKLVSETKGKPTTNYILKWDSQNTNYHVDLMVMYAYQTSTFGDVKYKTVMAKNYFNNITDKSGTYLLTQEDLYEVVKKDCEEFEKIKGPIAYPKVYMRYSKFASGKYTFGNWRYISVYNGSHGIIEGNSGDALFDDDGNVIEQPKDETFNSSGDSVNDAQSFGSLLDGMKNSPQVISSIFNGISSLVKGIGQVPMLLGSLLVGFPSEIWTLLTLGISCMVALGIFKIIRG